MEKEKKEFNYPNGRKWEESEVTFLRENAEKMSPSDIARVLKRSESSVKNKMRMEGLKKPERVHKVWTEKEEDYLFRWYGIRGAEKIGKELDRSKYSVRRHAETLGLVAYSEKISLKLLANAFDSDPRMIHRWREKYNLPMRKIMRGNVPYYQIDEEAFWTWAEKNKKIIPWHKYQKGSLTFEPKNINELINSDKKENDRAPITKKVRKQIEELYFCGHSVEEIAAIAGRSPYSIKHILSGKRKNAG